MTGLIVRSKESIRKLLELRAGELLLDVLRTARVRRDEGQIDLVLLRGRERDLGLLGFFLDALDGVGLLREIDAAVLLEFGDDPIHERVVPVVAAEVRVAVGRLHFEDAVADLEHRDIEGAAAEVVDRDLLVLLLVETVSERGRGRLVDDAEHFEAGDLAGVLGRVALRVVEVSGDGDDGLGDLLAELRFGVGLELRENHRGDFRRAESLLLAVHLHLDVGVAIRGLHDLVRNAMFFLADLVELAAHEALDRENRVCGIGDRLAFRGLADETLAVLGEGDDRRRGARAFAIFQNDRVAALHDGHAGVGRAEIDT